MSVNKNIITVGVGIFFVICYMASYGTLLAKREGLQKKNSYDVGIWNLSETVLLAISGEFRGLFADYLTLEAGARLGTELARNSKGELYVVKKNYNWPVIHSIFQASQVLDPSFAQTYINAQGWLPWEGNMVTETQEILRIAAKNRPWDWRPLHALGFNTYFLLENPGKAGKIFLRAAQKSNAPPFLSILGARLAQKGGETETAVLMMKSMLVEKDPAEPGYADIVERLQALEGTLLIEKALTRYKDVFGYTASSLDDLLRSGTLKEIPPNPYNTPYCLDSEGNVFFDNPTCERPTNM